MEFEEKTLNSTEIFNGKVIKVFKDEILTSNGYNSFREVVMHNGGVVILAFKGENVLFVRQFRYPLKEILLELPAGKLEIGEDTFEAAKRELEEETGYCAKKWTYMGFVYTSPGYSNEKLYLYKAEDLEYTHCHPDEGEVLQPLEVKYVDALKMINSGEIQDAKTLCAFMRCNL